MDLTQLTVEQLKVMAYDELTKLDIAQNNLKVLNQEIAKRMQETPKAEEPNKK